MKPEETLRLNRAAEIPDLGVSIAKMPHGMSLTIHKDKNTLNVNAAKDGYELRTTVTSLNLTEADVDKSVHRAISGLSDMIVEYGPVEPITS